MLCVMRRPSLPLAISTLALIVAMTGTAVAATGGNFILGRANSADATTSLANTARGAVLSLNAKSGQPPLAVSNGVQVPNLNASKLGGKNLAQIANHVVTAHRWGPSTSKEVATGDGYAPWGGLDTDGNPHLQFEFTKAHASTCLTSSFFASNFAVGQPGVVAYSVKLRRSDGAEAVMETDMFYFNALAQHQGWGGMGALVGWPAGQYQIGLYVATQGGTRIVTDSNDSATLTVTETSECAVA
jgi:hypothetical protein